MGTKRPYQVVSKLAGKPEIIVGTYSTKSIAQAAKKDWQKKSNKYPGAWYHGKMCVRRRRS